ncbi:MAG: DUF262 domain-containing HNH endonuclease family protein [Candidatus Pacebacteria bacterium]|nr:DUF262 domain-containing HNH endonuclease family protein [Candidatus Paceibacterota bacterium]
MQANNFKPDNVLYSGLHKVSTKNIIPSLQRPYTWDKKNINKFWEDIIENDSPYFIGTIVLVAGEGSSSRDEIIDGQQRLTTIALMLLALRDYIVENKIRNTERLKEDIRGLILEPQFEGEPVPRLEFINPTADIVYKEIIDLKPDSSNNAYEKNVSDVKKKFQSNYDELKKLIRISVVKDKIKPQTIFEKIKELEVVVIRCASKTSGYKLFEGLNATAVPLAGVDLIKNSLFMKLSGDAETLKKAEEKWQELEEKFLYEPRRMFQDFIRHQWLSSIGYVNHAGLFGEFEKVYVLEGDEKRLMGYIKELIEDADVYIALRRADISSLDKLPNIRFEKKEVEEVLQFLRYLNVDQVYPILLYIYKNRIQDFRKYLIRLTSFQFLFKYLPGSPSIVEKYFAQFCRHDIDAQKLFQQLEKLCSRQTDNFIETFLSKTKYSQAKSGDIQFILQRLLYSDSPAKSHRKPTIEHIISQKPSKINKNILLKKFGGQAEFRDSIHRIGNLTILEETDQGKYRNKAFKDKMNLYKKDVFKENQSIANYNFEENPSDAIKKRGENIAKRTYELFLSSLKNGKL